jgi:hypothetical protein
MKKLLLLFTLMQLSFYSFSQMENGIRVNIGAGNINSSNLNRILERNKQNDPYLNTSGSHPGNGLNLGVGYFANFRLTDRVYLSTDITLNILSAHLYVNYFRDSSNQNDGVSHRISSDSKINTVYTNIPILFRYSLSKKNTLFLMTGLSLGLMANPHLHSKELGVMTTYSSNVIDSTNPLKENINAVLNKHNVAQLHFVIGAEKRFRYVMKNLSLGFSYQLPLTKGMLYSTNDNINNTANNKFWGQEGKNQAEQINPGHRLNDFRMSTLNIVVKYYLNTSGGQ